MLAVPLTHIINASISSGTVPNHWKEAVVFPILKKGATTKVNNFRPVSNQDAKSTAEKESFSRNSAKIWNNAPDSIKTAMTLRGAKSEIKKHCKYLPV